MCWPQEYILFKIPTLVMDIRISMVSPSEGLFSPVSDTSQQSVSGEQCKSKISTQGYFFRIVSQLAVISVSGACGFEMITC